MQKRSEGNNDHTEIGDIFQVVEAEDIEEVENADNNKSSNLEANRRLSKTDENCTSVQKTNIRDRPPIEATSDVIEISGDNSDDGHGEKEITKSGKTIIFYSSHCQINKCYWTLFFTIV